MVKKIYTGWASFWENLFELLAILVVFLFNPISLFIIGVIVLIIMMIIFGGSC